MQLSVRSSLKLILMVSVVISLGLMAVTLTTTPDKLGPFGITLWFVGLLFAGGGFLTLGFYYFKRLMHSQLHKEEILAAALRQGILTSTWLVALAALNSLHQLGLKDI